MDVPHIDSLKGDFEKLFDSTEILLMHTGDLYREECEIGSLEGLERWVGDMLKIFERHHIESVCTFLWKSLYLIHTIPIFILQGMTRIAVKMYIRSHQDDARKVAFMEAGIEYEIMKPSHYCPYPKVKGVFAKKTSIIMKKKVEGNEKDGKDTHDNMETEKTMIKKRYSHFKTRHMNLIHYS